MLKKLFAVAVAVMAIAFAATTQAELRIALDPTIKPFIFKDAQDNLRGFDIDIAKIICREMKEECKFYPMEWAGLLPALQSGKVDMIVSGMTITRERAQVVDFSIPYYRTVAQMMALDPNVKVKTVGAGLGTNEEAALRAEGKYAVRVYDNQTSGLLDLANGRIDAFLGPKPELTEQAKDIKDKTFVFVGRMYTEYDFFGPGNGIALRKGDPRLAKVNEVIFNIRKSKEWHETSAKYFTDDIWAYPQDKNGKVIE